MKYFFLLFLTINLFSENINFDGNYGLKCKGDIVGVKNLSKYNLMYQFYDYDSCGGKPCVESESFDDSYRAWTPESAICGGSADYSILYNYYIDYKITYLLLGGIPNVTDDLKNDVNVYLVYPCLSSDVTYSVKLYEDYYNPYFSGISMSLKLKPNTQTPYKYPAPIEIKITHTEKEAKQIREFCSKPEYDLKPFIDELEQINIDIKAQFEALSNNSNKYNQAFLNKLILIKNTLITNSLKNNSNGASASLNNLVNKELHDKQELQDITNNYNDTSESDLINGISNFNSQYENSLQNVFSTYNNVFGFGDFGQAPSPIKLNFLGNQYTFFDVSVLNPYISIIRNIFNVCAYLFGLFLIFKGV